MIHIHTSCTQIHGILTPVPHHSTPHKAHSTHTSTELSSLNARNLVSAMWTRARQREEVGLGLGSGGSWATTLGPTSPKLDQTTTTGQMNQQLLLQPDRKTSSRR